MLPGVGDVELLLCPHDRHGFDLPHSLEGVIRGFVVHVGAGIMLTPGVSVLPPFFLRQGGLAVDDWLVDRGCDVLAAGLARGREALNISGGMMVVWMVRAEAGDGSEKFIYEGTGDGTGHGAKILSGFWRELEVEERNRRRTGRTTTKRYESTQGYEDSQSLRHESCLLSGR